MRTRMVVVVALALSACEAKLAGTVMVDERPFVLASCRSGQAYGFSGVELTAQDGRRLRLQPLASGHAAIIVMQAGALTGDELGSCGPLLLERQGSTINGIRNVMGMANLECAGAGHSVTGNLKFENCH